MEISNGEALYKHDRYHCILIQGSAPVHTKLVT